MTPKFRVWVYDEDVEKYIQHKVSGLVWEYNPDKLFAEYNYCGGTASIRIDTKMEHVPVLEQFTDKLDEDRKEIYEGDKVHVFVLSNQKPFTNTIEFRNGEFCLIGGEGHNNGSINCTHEIRIIGTIHD